MERSLEAIKALPKLILLSCLPGLDAEREYRIWRGEGGRETRDGNLVVFKVATLSLLRVNSSWRLEICAVACGGHLGLRLNGKLERIGSQMRIRAPPEGHCRWPVSVLS